MGPLYSLKTEVGSCIPSSINTVDATWTSTEDSLRIVKTPPGEGFFPEVGCPETKTDPKFPC